MLWLLEADLSTLYTSPTEAGQWGSQKEFMGAKGSQACRSLTLWPSERGSALEKIGSRILAPIPNDGHDFLIK